MCSAPSRSRAWPAASWAGMLAVAFATAGCAVPLGPGYTVERQRFEVTFASAPRPHVDVRATWRVKNTGDRPLAAVELKLPDANTHGRSELHAESSGSEITLFQAEAGNTVRI